MNLFTDIFIYFIYLYICRGRRCHSNNRLIVYKELSLIVMVMKLQMVNNIQLVLQNMHVTLIFLTHIVHLNKETHLVPVRVIQWV